MLVKDFAACVTKENTLVLLAITYTKRLTAERIPSIIAFHFAQTAIVKSKPMTRGIILGHHHIHQKNLGEDEMTGLKSFDEGQQNCSAT